MLQDSRFATFANKLVILAVETFDPPTVSFVRFANEAFKMPVVTVPMSVVVMVNVPMDAVVRFANDALTVGAVRFEMFAVEQLRILTLQLSVVTKVATTAICCEVPVTESVVMLANEVFKTARVSCDADRNVTARVPTFADSIFAEKIFARSSHCKCEVTFA
jgi:hypothetical protein